MTKYTVGQDGKTAWERRRGEKCKSKLANIGEKVLYLLKTAIVHQNKFEPKMFEGIWFRANARTAQTLIDTNRGAVKCPTAQRFPEEQKCDAKAIHQMKGTTSQPVPGIKSDLVPVEIPPDGTKAPRSEEDLEDAIDYRHIPVEEGASKQVEPKRGRIADIRVSQRDVDRYGTTLGGEACEYQQRNERIAKGVAHSQECRKSVREALMENAKEQETINIANRRQVQASAMTYKDLATGIDVHDKPKHIRRLEKELRIQMFKLMAEDIDVVEIYSPPRIVERATEMGSEGGWSLDLTTKDSMGRKWDLSKPEVRSRAIQFIKQTKPLLIVGSPMCTDMGWPRMAGKARSQRMQGGTFDFA